MREVACRRSTSTRSPKTYREPETFGSRSSPIPPPTCSSTTTTRPQSGMTQAEAAEMFEHMMAGLRANYPLFAGDNIFFFMQKSHYFLHLARDVTPDEFAERCRGARTARSASGRRAISSRSAPDTRELVDPVRLHRRAPQARRSAGARRAARFPDRPLRRERRAEAEREVGTLARAARARLLRAAPSSSSCARRPRALEALQRGRHAGGAARRGRGRRGRPAALGLRRAPPRAGLLCSGAPPRSPPIPGTEKS